MAIVKTNQNIDHQNFDEVAYVNQRITKARKGMLTIYSYFCLTMLMIVIGASLTIFPQILYAVAVIGFVFVSGLTILKYIFIDRSDFYLDCQTEKLKAEAVNKYIDYYRQEIKDGE